MKRKKWIAAALTLLLGMSVSAAALANSAPVYGSEEPTSQVLPLAENGIGVEKELLTFRMREDGSADVTADYTLRELTGKGRAVEMAFPFLLRLSDVKELDEVSILQDGQPLEYEFRLAGTVENEENGAWQDFLKEPAPFADAVKLENILAALDAGAYRPEHYKREKKLDTYVLNLPEDGKEYNIIVSMALDENDRLLEWGFNGFDLTDKERAELSTWVGPGHGEPQEYGFAVIGGDGPEDIQVSVYTEGYKKGPVQVEEIRIEKGKRSTAEDIVQENTAIAGPVENESANESITAARAEYALRELDRQLSRGQPVIASWDLASGSYTECYVGVLFYEVELPAEGTVQMTVNYRQRATWDASSHEGTVYTYAYLVSPASYFENFGRFEVAVVPAGDQLYITSASIPFAVQEDGSYLTALDGLPESELVFSMYREAAAPEKTLSESVGYSGMLNIISIGIIVAAAALLVFIVVLVVRVRKKK
ncbi:MAG: hypothetical protein IJP37_02600 [Clostridia bacterium]|nr:hypothetical protein [Clostridia bacterium]